MRRGGVLLHPTSLPGPYGIGDIGPNARQFAVWLEAAEQRIWQVLPLNPVDLGGSPYSSASSLARNTLLISPDDLVQQGFLRQSEVPYIGGASDRVDWDAVFAIRPPALRLAADRIRQSVELGAFREGNPWVDDWALFHALSQEHGLWWTRWPAALKHRDPAALAAARDRLSAEIDREIALQWAFAEQWGRLRQVCESRGVELWGDVPFFVGGESCDVWSNPGLFRIDREGRPSVVSGVPPDAFSSEGQHWGTPLYDEVAHRREGYAWWRNRFRVLLSLCDRIRIDHFRGVAAYWEIPEDRKPTEGRWIPGPGAAMLEALRDELGGLPLIAEDLGIITPDVEALRDGFDLPGMAILQFAFGDPTGNGEHAYLPHNHRKNLVVYPGTHDNDTLAGWYFWANERTKHHVRTYLAVPDAEVAYAMLRAAWRSVGDNAVVAMQDLLFLDGSARMNTPGVAKGNWAWRAGHGFANISLAQRLSDEMRLSGRARGRLR